MNLLLEPHQDDAVLFAAFTCLRYQPLVVTVLASQVQEKRGTGITNEQRVAENQEALSWLGCHNAQWAYSDANPDWGAINDKLEAIAGRDDVSAVFAPVVENDGHEHHNIVGAIARDVFGDRLRRYFTYRRGCQRSVGREVAFEPLWPMLKLRALACFESQIAEPSTRDWFLWGQREYVPW